jgi:hypothetical protein
MRNISFSATTEQVRARRKHVTRRFSKRPGSFWKRLIPDERLMAIEKGQGLRRGETVKRIGPIIVLTAEAEPLDEIIREPWRFTVPERIYKQYPHAKNETFRPCETYLEGFPGMEPKAFVEMFCEPNDCQDDDIITRIIFDYL